MYETTNARIFLCWSPLSFSLTLTQTEASRDLKRSVLVHSHIQTHSHTHTQTHVTSTTTGIGEFSGAGTATFNYLLPAFCIIYFFVKFMFVCVFFWLQLVTSLSVKGIDKVNLFHLCNGCTQTSTN